jgi:glycine cleavage system H protein
MSLPTNLKYAKSHEWALLGDDGVITVGITDHAQDLLGDVVFIEPAEIGSQFDANEECMLVESVKAASDIYMPIAGKVVLVNPALEDEPELVNEDCYGEGWLFKFQPNNAADLSVMLSADDYEASLDE